MTCARSPRRSARTTALSSRRTRTRTATHSDRFWRPSWRSTRSARTRSCTWPARRRCRASTRGCRSTTFAGRAEDAAARVLLALDCANESRLGPDPEVLHSAPLVVNVDHHHDNSRFGAVNLVVADASSTGEIVRDLLRELGVELTPDIAEALYIALVTDTGRFQYTNTTPKALRLAAELVEAGADVHKVFQDVYESVQFAKLKLLARALERAEVYEGGRLVISYLLRDDFAEVGAAEPYSEGIIDYLRAVEGADMAALIREPPRGDAPARRVSLRASADELDVSKIARASGRGVGTVRPPVFPATTRSRRLRSSSAASSSRRVHRGRARPAGSSSSTSRPALVVCDRSRPPRPDGSAGRACGDARPVRDGAPARPARELHEGGATLRRPHQAVRDGGRPRGSRRRPAIPKARSSTSTSRRPTASSRSGSTSCAARSICASRQPRRSRSAASAPTSCTAEASRSRCRCVGRPSTRWSSSTTTAVSPASRSTSAPAATCARSPRPWRTLREPAPDARGALRRDGCRPGAHHSARRGLAVLAG